MEQYHLICKLVEIDELSTQQPINSTKKKKKKKNTQCLKTKQT
jgi:hypothetical protein